MSLKGAFLHCAEICKLNATARFFLKNKIIVLMYHGIVPDDYPIEAWTMVKESAFRNQMEYLKRACKVISLKDAITKSKDAHSKSKPRIIITFDDGYRNNFSVAFPILKKFKFPATIFLTTGFIDTPEMFWFDKVIYSIQSTQCTILDLRDVNLCTYHFHAFDSQRRWGTIQKLLSKLKLQDISQREMIVRQIVNQLNPDFKNSCLFFPLGVSDIEEMHATSLVEFGSHTDGHEILTQLSPNLAQKTVSKSIKKIGQITHEKIRYFSYPNGNFNESLAYMLSELNILLAFTTIKGFWSSKSDLYKISRIGIGGYDSIELFAATISGLFKLNRLRFFSHRTHPFR